MDYNFSFTYLTCQTCKARIHCSECEDAIKQTLQKTHNIHTNTISIPKRTIELSSDQYSEDDILDILEDLGIFID